MTLDLRDQRVGQRFIAPVEGRDAALGNHPEGRSARGVAAPDVERDPLFNDAVRIVLESQRGSVSLLQRRLTVGYSRASRLIEQIAKG